MLSILGFIAGIVVLILFSFGVVTSTIRRQERSKSIKKEVVPKVNMPEPGVCQCGDALCYHATGPCSIPNCYCQLYIDSAASNEELNASGGAPLARLALEATNARQKYELAEMQAIGAKKEADLARRTYERY